MTRPGTPNPADSMENQGPRWTSLKGSRVLVADDEPLVLSVVTRMLRRAQAEVTTTRSTDEAIQVFDARTTPFHLLLTDVVMPDGDGMHLARALRQRDPELAVVFMSGWSSYTDADRELSGPLLAKPFTSDALREAVLGALNASARTPDD